MRGWLVWGAWGRRFKEGFPDYIGVAKGAKGKKNLGSFFFGLKGKWEGKRW